jgi:hypothetical protein
MVRLVSAIAVASTTRRRPGTAVRARSWSAAARRPCSASTSTCGPASPIADATRRISGAPGRNTSTSPSSMRRARWTAAATASGWSCMVEGPSQSMRTGWGVAPPSMTGAPSSTSATAAPSSVADITTRRRSGRSVARMSSSSASAVSTSRLRSWNSSRTTAAMPSSDASACRRRISTPSVTTSTRVAPDTFVSPRMRQPTRRPTASPRVAAMRCAAARAARRRGSTSSTRPSHHGASSIASGTTVVLPLPGGATSTAAEPGGVRASRSAPRTSWMGSVPGSLGRASAAPARSGPQRWP